MNSVNNQAISILADQVISTTKQMIKEAPFDRTVKTKILAYLGANRYLIKIDGCEYSAVSENVRNIGDVVFVTICNNDYNNIIIQSNITKTNQSSEWTLETKQLTL